jgi:hypothetical protein
MGNGYAILDFYQPDMIKEEEKFQNLSHQLSWCESPEEIFHATWNNMPTWCRYCHKDGHTKFECEQSRARILCYSCHQQGHRSFECPRRNPAPANKRQDRKSYQISEHLLSNSLTHESPKKETIEEDRLSDKMSTCDSELSLTEDEKLFLDQVSSAKMALDNMDATDRQSAIQDEHNAGNIAPSTSPQGIITWTLVNKSPEAVAIVEWMTERKYQHLDQSPSIVGRRTSQILQGDSSSNPTTSNL